MAAISGSLYFSLSTTLNNCYGGDDITFEFISEYQPTSKNWTGSFSLGSLTIDLQPTLIGGYPYATSSVDFGDFAYSIQSPNIIILNGSLSSFDEDYQQIPTWQSASLGFPITVKNSLYNAYGDINHPFAPRFNDKAVIKSIDGRTQIVTIQSTTTINNRLQLIVSPNLDVYFINNPSQIDELLIVKRLADEQNIIMTFNKPPGDTSYGFLIPEDINLDVVNNISTIQSNVQNQLLSTQQNSQ
jgi:hypothetical protein